MKYKTENVIIGSILTEDVYYKDLIIARKGAVITKNIKKLLIECSIEEVTIEPICSDTIHTKAATFGTVDGLLAKYITVADISERMILVKELIIHLIEGELREEMAMIKEYDEGTYRHSKNVAVIALLCGTFRDLSKSEAYYLSVSSLLHDYGKICIPLSILRKKGPLDEDERDIMQTHTVEGKRLLDMTSWKDTIVPSVVLKHHENWDGTGYPDKNNGFSCNKLARIIHIADVYEALIAKRPYKEHKMRQEARSIIASCSGKMFDPSLSKMFLAKIPPYFIGEEVIYNGVFATVVDVVGLNPVLQFVNGDIKEVDGRLDSSFEPQDLELIK